MFLPEFQERSLVVSTSLYPGESLNATNQASFAIQDALKDDPNFEALALRSGRAAGDSDVGGVNYGELDVEISKTGVKNREKIIEKLREEFARIPGVAANIGGFISHRMDEVLSGVRSAIAVKVFGPDLEQLRAIGKQVEAAVANIPGVVDLQLEPQVPIKQIQIKFDRTAAARYGLAVGDLAEIVETALNGRVVSQVLEQQQVFDLVVWMPEGDRQNLDLIRNLLVDTPPLSPPYKGGDERGGKIPLAQVAKVDYGTGPNTINRENVSRLIVISANVKGRDLGSLITDIRKQVKQKVQLPAGYYIQYGGQF